MATIGPALGVGSGLDLNSLLDKLMAAESIPYTKLQAQEASTQAKVSAYGSLRGALSSLRDAAGALAGKFTTAGAASSDKEVATATATIDAEKGSHSLEVISLAQSQRISSAGVANSEARVRPGTLTFTFGSVEGGAFVPDDDDPLSITIGAGKNTLEDVRDAINDATLGVTASIVNDGTETRLVVASNDTGAERAFKITAQEEPGGSGTPLSFLEFDPVGSPAYGDAAPAGQASRLQAASDATFKLNGLTITSADNKVSDAIDGMTITLLKEGKSTLTISADTSGAAKAMEALVKAYNDYLGTAKSLSVNTPSPTRGEASTTGPLAGDSLLRDVGNRLRAEIFNKLEGAPDPYSSLASLGVSFQKDGTLKFDSGIFNEAMASDAQAVARLFESAPFGEGSQNIAERFTSMLDGVLDEDGMIDSRLDGLDSSTKLLQKQQDQLETRLTQIEKNYRKQFTALDSLMTQMDGTANFLSQQLSALASLRG